MPKDHLQNVITHIETKKRTKNTPKNLIFYCK